MIVSRNYCNYSTHLNIAIVFFLLLISTSNAFSQNVYKAVIKDQETNETLAGATVVVLGTTIGGSTDENGLVEIHNIPDGIQVLRFSLIGYKERTDTLEFPLPAGVVMDIVLESEEEELEEIIVTTTRSTRTIENIPTRVEFIGGEELEEKGNMKPGDIRMMLNESTGIQTQQTSATSYNSSIRIQGLDGKYTQILRDGFPMYAGFSGGLSLLQIVPLDLKQVEVIKGASSTLYGGGAIAGLVNLISKTPKEERELHFLFNGTSARGADASGFYSQKFSTIGTTLFTSYNVGIPYDPSGIGLTAIPKFTRFTINPKLLVYFDEHTTLHVGMTNISEDRIGGDMKYIEGRGDSVHSYFEKNTTNRFSTQAELERMIDDESKFAVKTSVSFYNRTIEIPNYIFSGIQRSTFSELNYRHTTETFEWIGGVNLWTDNFTQEKQTTLAPVDYRHTTVGAFLQNTWNATEKFSLESGLRGDYQNEFGLFLLPRISGLFKFNHDLSARLGGGLGYKTPTVFTEDAERIQFNNVLPLDAATIDAERSIGGNFDVNYRTPLSEDVSFSINTLFFYTQVKNPLILTADTNGFYEFRQPKGFVDTRGIETNIKITYEHFKLFIGYTLADVRQHYGDVASALPLVATHRLNNVLMYAVEDKLKIGLEAYYIGPQTLTDGTRGKDYWITGLMAEKLFGQFSLFVNFENFIDTRQTKFDTIYNGTITNPMFRDIYAPVDGFVINGGVKVIL